MTFTDPGLDAAAYRAAANRCDDLARRLLAEAMELDGIDPHDLGGDGRHLAQAATLIHTAASRVRNGGRALQILAAACRSQAASHGASG